jgi:hypothetical protein
MWPAYVAGMLAVAAVTIGLVLGVAAARRAAVVCGIAAGTFALAGIAMYGITEARYQACMDNPTVVSRGTPQATESVRLCRRRVFGSGDVETVRIR